MSDMTAGGWNGRLSREIEIGDVAPWRKRVAELEREKGRLEHKLEWKLITPENMPGLDDEIGRWHKNRFWQVDSSFVSHGIEDYQTEYEGGGWTHFRPINPPQPKAKP